MTADTFSTRLRTAARLSARISVTGGVIVIAAVAVLAGRGVLSDRAEAVPAPVAAPVLPVAVTRLALQDHLTVTRRFSGQIEARQEVALAFEQAGTIEEIRVREGDQVSKGEVIAQLDTRRLEAEEARLSASRRAAEAQVELARRTNERQTELRERGFATNQGVDDTSLTLARLEASIAEIDAALQGIRIDISKASLVAPFEGRIGVRHMDTGAIAAPGVAVVSLLEAAAPRFRAGLDPTLAATLDTGDPVQILLSGEVHDATLGALAPDLDPATRSRMAFFDLDADLAAGETGTVLLPATIEATGAWVPLTALRPGPQGTWTLLTVADEKVTLEAAEILQLDGDSAFIRGTFTDGTAFIPTGTHRVVPGQTVAATEDLAWAR